MKNLKFSCSTIVISDELKRELEKLSFEDAQKIITDNVEIIKTSDDIEMLTLLLDIEDNKIVSKKDASEDTKKALADKQYSLLKENMHKKEFKKGMKKQMKVALKMQKQIVESTGNTPIKWFGSTIKVLPLPVNEFIAICYSVFNLILSYYTMITYNTNVGISRFSILASMVANIINVILLSNCIFLAIFKDYKIIDEKKED